MTISPIILNIDYFGYTYNVHTIDLPHKTNCLDFTSRSNSISYTAGHIVSATISNTSSKQFTTYHELLPAMVLK